jgi:putative ABC transport system ATP-binding protein
MLELERVAKHYRGGGEEVRAVDEVSLCVHEGELIALQGPSGSGKTTLLLLAACVLRADAGSIRYRGRDLATMSEREAALPATRDRLPGRHRRRQPASV